MKTAFNESFVSKKIHPAYWQQGEAGDEDDGHDTKPADRRELEVVAIRAMRETMKYFRASLRSEKEVARAMIVFHQSAFPDDYTQDATATQLGVSQPRVNQILMKKDEQNAVFAVILSNCHL